MADYESGTLYTSDSGGNCPIRIRYSYTQNYSLNQTTLTAYVEIYRSRGYMSNNSGASKYINLDGGQQQSGTGFNVQNQSEYTWANLTDYNGSNPLYKTWIITHNDDGTKSVTLKAVLNSGVSIGTKTIEQRITLHQIPVDMNIRIGDNVVKKVFIGTTPIKKVYYGDINIY